MKTERELFSQWVKKEHAHIFNGAEQGNARFKMDIDFMYMAWQASAQREGYKLVPVEPTYKQLDALKSSCELFKKAGVSDLEAHGAYKAMIGASE